MILTDDVLLLEEGESIMIVSRFSKRYTRIFEKDLRKYGEK